MKIALEFLVFSWQLEMSSSKFHQICPTGDFKFQIEFHQISEGQKGTPGRGREKNVTTIYTRHDNFRQFFDTSRQFLTNFFL